ncbi:hypothetical protein Tco_0367809 [Tanacetum coccineum]
MKIFEDYYSEDQYAVSIKEDTTYPCLHSPKTTKEKRSIRRILKKSIHRIEDIVCEYSRRYQTWSLLQETPIRLLGWLLEEIHVTWAHLEKKRTRLRLYTKSLEEIRIQTVETASGFHAMPSGFASDGVRCLVTTSERSRPKESLEDLVSQDKEVYSTCA